MDPHANLVDYLRAVNDGDSERIRELADALANWIEKGNYRPDTTAAIHALFNMGD